MLKQELFTTAWLTQFHSHMMSTLNLHCSIHFFNSTLIHQLLQEPIYTHVHLTHPLQAIHTSLLPHSTPTQIYDNAFLDEHGNCPICPSTVLPSPFPHTCTPDPSNCHKEHTANTLAQALWNVTCKPSASFNLFVSTCSPPE